MRIPSSLQHMAQVTLENFHKMMASMWQSLAIVVNGNLTFGDGTTIDNINGSWVNVVAPAAPNTDFTVNHNLNRIPVGYWVMKKDRACDLYTGSVAATVNQLTLRATVASAVLRIFIICALLGVFSLSSFAQTTLVSGTVTAADGQTWNSGTYTFTFVPSPRFNGTYFLNGVPFNPTAISGTLSVTGTFSNIVVPSNTSITPSGTFWTINVCPQGSTSQCSTSASILITGASQNITSSISPPALSVNCGVGVVAYQDSEVNCTVGGSYYNLISQVGRVCQVSNGNSCITWATVGGGGSGPSLRTNGVVNTVQTIMNLLNGTGISLTADGAGGVTVTNTLPGQPSCAPNGTVQVASGIGFGCGPPVTTVAIKPILPNDPVQYVSSNSSCNDSNDGLSVGSAKCTVYAALQALPNGSVGTAGGGTVLLSGTVNYGGPLAPNGGMWLMSSSDPNFASPPSGWLKRTAGVALTIDCLSGSGAAPHGHLGACTMNGGSAADQVHPAVWISGGAGNVVINNISFSGFISSYVKYGICSNNDRTGTCGSSGFSMTNVSWNHGGGGFGRGPGLDIGSQSFWIWLTDCVMSGNPQGVFVVAAVGAVRSSGVTTITTTATNDIQTNDMVTITNVSDDSFNGSYIVTRVDSTHFTYPNVGPNTTSGTGQVVTYEAAAVNIDGGATGSGSGLIFLENINTNNGTIRYRQGLNGGGFYVHKLSYEGSGVPDPPTILITGTSATSDADGTNIHIDDVEISDISNPAPGVQVDNASAFPDLVVVSRIAGTVRGKMTVLGGTSIGPGNNATYLRQQQYGLRQGQLTATGVDVARRNFSPVAVQKVNIANTTPASWVFSPGSGTITSNITAPDGTTGAGRITGTGAAFIQFYGASTTVNIGDIYVFGAWSRSNTANGYVSAVPPIKFVLNNNGFGVGDACAGPQGTPPGNGVVFGNIAGSQQSDGQWQWYSGVCKIVANPTSAGISFNGAVDSTHTVDFYAPVLAIFPAGSISDNESYEIAFNMNSWPTTAAIGEVSMLPGQLFRFGTRTFANLGTPADGTIVFCPDCATLNPCTGGGTGAFAQRTNGAWNCAGGVGGIAPPSLSIQYDNSGVAGGIPVPTTPNGVPEALSSTPAGGVGTVAGFKLPGVVPRDTVCPSNLDTILATDRAGLVRWNDASACAVSLPQAGSGGGGNNDFTSNFVFLGCNIGVGVATVTPTISTLTVINNGVITTPANLPLSKGQCAFFYSDNANYTALQITSSGLSQVQTNTVNNTSQTLLNLINSAALNGITLTVTNTSGGIVQLGYTGTLNNSGLTNSATTVNGQTCTLGSTCTIPPGTITVANAGTTGTTVNTLTKLVGAPSTAVITATTDTGGVVGITTSGAGTAGSAVIQLLGSVSCVFDGATIAGDYVQISSTTVGDCHDVGASYPSLGQVIGRVLTTNGAGGTFIIDLFPSEITNPSATNAARIASGTAAMNTSAIGSGSCATVVTVSATGVATTDTVTTSFNSDPTAVTGYGASATGAVLTIYPYPTTNNVNFKVCNSTANSITPGALTLNWRVVR